MPNFGSRFAAASLLAFGAFGVVIACSSSNERPSAATNGEGGVVNNSDATAPVDATVALPAHCKDKAKSEDESDLDCGGRDCLKCEIGLACTVDTDCGGGSKCSNKICAICDDNKTDGSETDVDCGGLACGACTVGKRCKANTDCKSGTCNVDTCACPVHMAIVPLAGGGAYCVDQTETTKGEYNKFITANVPVGDQVDICKPPANTTFVPGAAWPPSTTPTGIAYSYGLPVHYVDWCDAFAYCKWAKKELCGTIGGGTLAPADYKTQTKSAWYNACSAQGTKTYPYGTGYDSTKCNGDTVVSTPAGQAGGDGYAANQDDGIWQINGSDGAGNVGGDLNVSCQGGVTSLYQMSGNVAEWEDSCDGTTTTANCAVRGGSYAASSTTQLACDAQRLVPRLAAATDLADVGIRCCVY